jgi:hypothetical protein
MTDWLTAHPDAKYILSTTINDDRAVGIANAMIQAGRGDPTKDGIVIGKNADEAGLAAVRRPDTPYVGTVAFFGQLYGEWATGLMLDILEGKPVPSIVSVPHEVITKDNIDKWFPEGGTPTAAAENPTLTQNPGDPNQERYWVKYNFDTGAFELDPTVTADPRSWKPNLRQVPEGTVICFTAESEEFAWDTVYVNPSMDEAGKKTGAKILRFNNAYPSTSQPLANAMPA